MQEPTDTEKQRQRAEQLRAEVEELLRGGTGSAPASPRDFTDRAAHEASEDD
jgi:hypothetical protein